MQSNNASFVANTVEHLSVALVVTPNNENFLSNMLLKTIQVSVPQFHHKSDWDIDLL